MSSIEDAFADNNNRRSPLEGTGDDQVQRKRGEHDDDDYYIDITQYCMNGCVTLVVAILRWSFES